MGPATGLDALGEILDCILVVFCVLTTVKLLVGVVQFGANRLEVFPFAKRFKCVFDYLRRVLV